MESGASVKCNACQEYGVNKQTVSDIRKVKSKFTEYAVKYSIDRYSSNSGSVAACKHMKTGGNQE